MPNRVMVIDDEIEIADLIDVYLRNENYEVLKYYSPKAALANIGGGSTRSCHIGYYDA